ncbi:MAG: invasion associated locus B family protein, partial [Gammaproteobacteria bacterium]|nr:invasion associated locus B family protein [Gammaproteobacteria bacterium]
MQFKALVDRAVRAALLACVCASGVAGAAPEHGRSFQDWTVRCEQPAGGGDRCFIFQNLVLKDTGERLVHVAVGHLTADGRAAAVVTLPLGISLPPGAAISIDDGEPVRFAIERCDANGCIGALELGERMVAAMKRG